MKEEKKNSWKGNYYSFNTYLRSNFVEFQKYDGKHTDNIPMYIAIYFVLLYDECK